MCRVGLTLKMASQTIEYFAISGTGMAGRALVPLPLMGATEDRKKLGIMLGKLPLLSGRMTQEAILRIIRIAANPRMIAVHLRLIMFVAGKAVDDGSIYWRSMTGFTFIPFPVMFSAENREKLSVVSDE